VYYFYHRGKKLGDLNSFLNLLGQRIRQTKGKSIPWRRQII
jgi:hypothetical protein